MEEEKKRKMITKAVEGLGYSNVIKRTISSDMSEAEIREVRKHCDALCAVVEDIAKTVVVSEDLNKNLSKVKRILKRPVPIHFPEDLDEVLQALNEIDTELIDVLERFADTVRVVGAMKR